MRVRELAARKTPPKTLWPGTPAWTDRSAHIARMASVSRTPYAAPSAAYDIEKGAAISAFADAQIRVGFVRKVFGACLAS